MLSGPSRPEVVPHGHSSPTRDVGLRVRYQILDRTERIAPVRRGRIAVRYGDFTALRLHAKRCRKAARRLPEAKFSSYRIHLLSIRSPAKAVQARRRAGFARSARPPPARAGGYPETNIAKIHAASNPPFRPAPPREKRSVRETTPDAPSDAGHERCALLLPLHVAEQPTSSVGEFIT